MNSRQRLIWLLAVPMVVTFQALPAKSDEQVTFDQLLKIALEHSPEMLEIESAIADEKASAIEVGVKANPELFGEVKPYVSDANEQDTEFEVGIEQNLRPSDFGTRAKVADLISRANTGEQKRKLLEFEQGLLLLYGKAWALQQKSNFTAALNTDAKRLATAVAAGNEKGLFSESIGKLMLAETIKLNGEIELLKSDQQRTLAELTKWVGVSLRTKSLAMPTFKELPSADELLANPNLPLTERIKLRVAVAVAQEKMARLDAFPQFSPRLSFEHTNDGDDRLNVGLALELPLSDRNQAARIRFAAERRAAEAKQKYLNEIFLKEDLAHLLEALKASTAQISSLNLRAIPALDDALVASHRELDAGQGNPYQAWQTLKELSQLQDRYLELWTKALSERVELSILLGQSI